ncbi:TonB-dependent siderophore receptor [Sphingomonas sp. PP-CE-1G-424]|uniref:TonB-dependent siderophore receptor n=1 Tax=Sphingomonas sp. PP-CE-1G-424 TaxID=2135658 RepID=UPI001056807B|nr:TonB-dependent siderophore receptor [Sphingomonas sp. PP-CE-1G-424]TCP65600.1 iron complex outermembrane receptor protein [Sphingomonas sp. PP-CE-1G-424]
MGRRVWVAVLAGTALGGILPSSRAIAAAQTGAAATGSSGALATVDDQADVVVTARRYPTETANASKSGLPILKTPQAINTVSAEEIAVRGVQSIAQAIQNTPGVVTQYGDTDVRYDWISIRGFNPGRYLDGLRLPFGARGYSQMRIEPYGLERIEVLKGPASALYGQSAPGGLLNMVSKRPTDIPLHEILLQAASYDRYQAGIDFGGPFGQDGRISYRLTGLARTSNTPIDYLDEKRVFIAPALRLQPDDRTSITLLGEYQKISSNGGGAPAALPTVGTLYPNRNGKIPRSVFIGDPDYDHFSNRQWSVGAELRHALDDHFSFQQNVRYSSVRTDTQRVQAIALAADGRTLSRYAWAFPETSRVFSSDTRLTAKFATGTLTHDLLLGLDYQFERARYEESALRLVSSIDIFNPVYTGGIVRPAAATIIAQKRDQTGIYGQYILGWGRLSLVASGRSDMADSSTVTATAATGQSVVVRQQDNKFTGRAGVTYMVTDRLSAYAAYGTSFQPTAGTDRLGATFDPTTGKQWEAGTKYQLSHGLGLITLAAYDLHQTNVLTPDPANIRYNTQAGEGHVHGIELEAKLTPVTGLNLIGSYAYSRSKVLKANPNASGLSILGNELPFVSNHQASARADYTVQAGSLRGLGLGFGGTYFGRLFGDAANLYRIPGAIIFDAALRYDLGVLVPSLHGINLAVNASNLFDRRYLKTCIAAAGCYFGARRTILGSVRYNF